jgi:hypothetical protein
MPQPVKLSDMLIDAARDAAADSDRSLAGQIEHWARLGRSVEGALTLADANAVKNNAGHGSPARLRAAVLQSLRLALSASGHPHLGAGLVSSAGARYGTDPAFPGLLVRVGSDGKRTAGRLKGRRFVPLEVEDDLPTKR